MAEQEKKYSLKDAVETSARMQELQANAKVYQQKQTPEHRKLVEEANKQVEEGRRREAKAWIKARDYIAF